MKTGLACWMVVGRLAAVVVLAAGVWGCGHDAATEEIESGLSMVREGVVTARDGAARFEAGDRSAGLARLEIGLADGRQGIDHMHHGLALMGDEGMGGCCRSMHVSMGRLDDALTDMMHGHAEWSDADPKNDAAGGALLHASMDSMEAGLDDAEGFMGCMDHDGSGHMMGGGK